MLSVFRKGDGEGARPKRDAVLTAGPDAAAEAAGRRTRRWTVETLARGGVPGSDLASASRGTTRCGSSSTARSSPWKNGSAGR